VVGTRGFSAYGEISTKRVVQLLAEHDFTIVSGMAFGIDAIAHKEAMNSGTKTIAVLASSADQATPRGNRYLYDRILESGGLVVSETLPGERFLAVDFPKRNRLISGLSSATIVTEAGIKSGALITARQAFDQSRKVYALPAGIEKKRYQGTNELIYRDIARVIYSDEILLQEFMVKRWDEKRKREVVKIKLEWRPIMNSLKTDPKTLDEMKESFDIDCSILLASLTEMEMKGVLKQDEIGRYFYIY
ncbi:DNA-protecting protein DprA, partial [Candidatus Dojkabacteria bacterium]|nr:DNA-protecting protein DprA [Candidatus Dojkabacteria bacterium]